MVATQAICAVGTNHLARVSLRRAWCLLSRALHHHTTEWQGTCARQPSASWLVVGEAGLGKSTLIACLLKVQDFGAELEIYKNQGWQRAEELPGGESTLKVRWYRYHFTEMFDGVSVRTCFEIIDTPGFASQINSDNSWVEKWSVIEKGFQSFRKRKPTDRSDSRVDLALYVLLPQPRPLKELDKRVMAELQCCVPLLPVIAEADTFDAKDPGTVSGKSSSRVAGLWTQ